jgi:hypothetical protein
MPRGDMVVESTKTAEKHVGYEVYCTCCEVDRHLHDGAAGLFDGCFVCEPNQSAWFGPRTDV